MAKQDPNDPDDPHELLRQMEQEYDAQPDLSHQNLRPYGFELHNPVFTVSSALILVFVMGAMVYPERANDLLGGTQQWIQQSFDWLFLIAGNFFVLFCLLLILLPVGGIRLGGQEAKPDFSVLSWFCMLFAAGMGIGLMFWSVAEPVGYYTEWAGTPLNVEGGTEEGYRAALGATMYHWGLHPWAIYGVVALSLAFFAYNKGLPMTVRSIFFPLIGDRAWGRTGDVIDVLAVLATIFGLATSLGLGAQQAASGLHYLFGVPNTLATQIAIIIGVTVVALISVLRGIDGGIKVLSNFNISMAGLLLMFVLVTGGAAFWTTFSAYAGYIFPLSNPVGREDQTFYHSWTVFFWAWWISWSPFVGMFIARVSRGRTVRQFITAVLLVPTAVTVVWMGVFGVTGLNQARDGVGDLAQGISHESLALYQLLEHLPWSTLTATVAIVLVLVFFVTSADSGSLVIDSITSGGKTDAPDSQRVYWVTLKGLIAGTLLFVGGEAALSALQAGAVSTGLPFTVVLLAMCVSLLKGLEHERKLLKLAPT